MAMLKELGPRATLRDLLGSRHVVAYMDDLVYDLAAGQYAKFLKAGAPQYDEMMMAIASGVWKPSLHDDFMRIVARGLGL